MRKKVPFSVFLLLICLSLLFQETSFRVVKAEQNAEGIWGERAERAQDSLQANFWNKDISMFNNKYPNENDDGFNYWWQAHAIDVLVDAYERTGEQKYIDRADSLYSGVVERNGGITNHFYDDMLWMALAMFRLYEHTNDDTHKNAVFTLWEDIKTGWRDDLGGGIAWNKDSDFLNTPSNAPAIILAARLYQEYGNESDLEWARKIYEWQTSTLVDPETGIVYDGIEGDDFHSEEYTYNQGTYVGANIELFRITKDQEYLQSAIRTAETTIERFTDENQIIHERGGGDGGLFNGILIRYLSDLALEDPTQEPIAQLILHNAESAWQLAESEDEILFGASWKNPPNYPVDLSQNLSGVMLMEQASILDRTFSEPSLEDLFDRVERLANGDEMTDPQAVRTLKVHLRSIEHFEKKKAFGKMEKHLDGFNILLDQQKELEVISAKAHRELRIATNRLIEHLAEEKGTKF